MARARYGPSLSPAPVVDHYVITIQSAMPCPPPPPTTTAAAGLPETFAIQLYRDAVARRVQHGRVDPYTITEHVESLIHTAVSGTRAVADLDGEARTAQQRAVDLAVAELYSMCQSDAVAVAGVLTDWDEAGVVAAVDRVRVVPGDCEADDACEPLAEDIVPEQPDADDLRGVATF